MSGGTQVKENNTKDTYFWLIRYDTSVGSRRKPVDECVEIQSERGIEKAYFKLYEENSGGARDTSFWRKQPFHKSCSKKIEWSSHEQNEVADHDHLFLFFCSSNGVQNILSYIPRWRNWNLYRFSFFFMTSNLLKQSIHFVLFYGISRQMNATLQKGIKTDVSVIFRNRKTILIFRLGTAREGWFLTRVHDVLKHWLGGHTFDFINGA